MLDSSEPSWRLATLSTFKWACHSPLTNRKIQLKKNCRGREKSSLKLFLFANSLESIFRVVRHAKAATRCPLSFTRCAYRNNNYSPFTRRSASELCRRQKINNKKYDNRIYLYQFSRAICMSLTTRKPANMDFFRNNSTYGGKKKRQLMLKSKSEMHLWTIGELHHRARLFNWNQSISHVIGSLVCSYWHRTEFYFKIASAR